MLLLRLILYFAIFPPSCNSLKHFLDTVEYQSLKIIEF